MNKILNKTKTSANIQLFAILSQNHEIHILLEEFMSSNNNKRDILKIRLQNATTEGFPENIYILCFKKKKKFETKGEDVFHV